MWLTFRDPPSFQPDYFLVWLFYVHNFAPLYAIDNIKLCILRCPFQSIEFCQRIIEVIHIKPGFREKYYGYFGVRFLGTMLQCSVDIKKRVIDVFMLHIFGFEKILLFLSCVEIRRDRAFDRVPPPGHRWVPYFYITSFRILSVLIRNIFARCIHSGPAYSNIKKCHERVVYVFLFVHKK